MSDRKSADAAPRLRSRGCLRWGARLFAFGLVLLVLACAALGFGAYIYVTGTGTGGEPARVTIPPGASGKEVGALLADHGLVVHEALFRMAMYLDKSSKPIRQGLYDLPRGQSPTQILRILQEGSNVKLAPDEIPDERKVTVPEGLTVAQTAELFEHPEAFLDAASDTTFIAKLGVQASSLEGFLMPNTYYFDERPTERQVVERMVDQFQRVYADLLREIPEAANQDVMRVVTIASLIEQEAREDSERPLVSAVIHNRLERGIPLGLDSTLQYVLNKYGQPMLDTDKEVDSPYNTYRHAGVPPGPVSNPGVACLRAALSPAPVDYLYFVSNADGKTHTFSKTLEEHDRARARYRKEITVQRRELKQQQGAS